MKFDSVVCRNCGVENWDAVTKPELLCPICSDQRQFLDREGQTWLTQSDLGNYHVSIRSLAEGAFTLRVQPTIGIGHTSFLLDIGNGWLLWDPLPVVARNLELFVKKWAQSSPLQIAASHPHMYGAQSQWADTYCGHVFINKYDSAWTNTHLPRFEVWDENIEISSKARLVRIGGHFPGSSYLIWETPGGEQWLFVSDTNQIRPNGRFSFMWSYPNLLPLGKNEVEEMLSHMPKVNAGRALDNFGRIIDGDIFDNILKSAEEHLTRLEA